MNECYCQSADSEARDVQISNLSEYEGTLYPQNQPWAAITSDNMVTFFETEEDACTFQRHWRELMHLDPMTGRFLISV